MMYHAQKIFALTSIAVGCIWMSASQPIQTGPATEKRFPPLKLPPGFKATLFACDPLIEYPSVIAIGPKPGAIFVAIDYMTGLGTDGKVKSEIRLVEDTDGDGYADKATAVAKGFNSIQGLAYHDGTLFVMHAPFLSTVRGGERKDLLTGLGLKPEDNPSRLHCANGVVVGHDGWLYLAIGDNGVNILRPEGDRLIHNGGGILRCRPDGRDLHIFSTGLRNIYDIALDADLNVFTRDNENDGGTYMIRVCHCFHGSDHGYPYDYEERPDHAMKPIGDFGLGSSAGGVCYLETQFPKEYRGNLFFCEWGKSVVRYELKRAGSGFAPVKEIGFATGDPKDAYPFKPTDIVVQRDGTLMVSDYADGQRPKRGRGRIYHIAYVGQGSDKPSAGLDSESYRERCHAQAALERIGKTPMFTQLGSRGRLHAVWALARVGGAKAIDDLITFATLEMDPAVRAHAIRAIADISDPVLVKHKLDAGRGDPVVAERLELFGRKADAREVLEVVVALGRLRWAGSPDWLRENLGKPDASLAHAVMQTLRRSNNWPAVVKLLDLPSSEPVRAIALHAVVDQYEPLVIDGLLARLANDKDPSRRREYAETLARVYKKPGPWKYWGYRPGPRPANTEEWEHTVPIRKALNGMLADPDPDVRLAVMKRMKREKVPVLVEPLREWLKSDHHPERVAFVLAEMKDASAAITEELEKIVRDKEHSVANRLTAVTYIARDSDKFGPGKLIQIGEALEEGPVLADVLRRLGRYPTLKESALLAIKLKSVPLLTIKLQATDAEVRAAAIEALGELGAKEGIEPVPGLLKDKDVRVRRAAAVAAGKLGAKQAIEPLLKLGSEPDVELRLACLESLRRLRERRVLPLASAALAERGLQLKALECLAEFNGPVLDRVVVKVARDVPTSEMTIAAVRALTHWRDDRVTTPQERDTLNRAIAEVQGTAGLLVGWRASGPIADKDAATTFLKQDHAPPDWRPVLAAGPEARLILASRDVPGDARWYLRSEIALAESAEFEFFASGRGRLQIWLDGKALYRRDNAPTSKIESGRFAATLAKGNYRVLVETGTAKDGAEFDLRFRRKSSKAAHEKLTQAALARTGNAERGRKVFFDKDKSQCIKCHQLGTQGERFGPELTGVGGRFSRIYLIESILEPSRTIAPSFGTLVVALRNGKTVNGVKIAEDEKTLSLADNQGQKHVLAKADIDEQNPSAISTMPEGLEVRITEDEFVDLIAFLASQK